MTSIVFNSVPTEDIDCNWGSNPAYERVTSLIREIRRYGVIDIFEPEDLIEKRNIAKVTKCLAQLSKLVSGNSKIRSYGSLKILQRCVQDLSDSTLKKLKFFKLIMMFWFLVNHMDGSKIPIAGPKQ